MLTVYSSSSLLDYASSGCFDIILLYFSNNNNYNANNITTETTNNANAVLDRYNNLSSN
jgi:hypothetical protein